MEKGLGDLGFWLAVGMVIAAVIIAGAIKERAKERERQSTLRALLEKGGDNATEVLGYLRERDAAEAARAGARLHRKRMNPRQEMAFVGAFLAGIFSFMGGFFTPLFMSHPANPRFVFSPQAGRVIPEFPPAPTGLDALLPIGLMLGIWAAGLIVAVLFLIWGGFGKKQNDAQPDA